MLDGLDGAIKALWMLAIVGAISIPLAIWKLWDIAVWLITHVHIV